MVTRNHFLLVHSYNAMFTVIKFNLSYKGVKSMLTSLSLIFLLGLAMAAVCTQIKLPSIIGMLITGIIIGPYALNLLDPSIIEMSSDLRKVALVIILIKAGMSFDLKDLKKVGRPALLMAFLPAVFEITAFVVLSPYVLGISRLEGAVIGSILGAVSPAVVVPKMVQLIEDEYGTEKGIPQMILTGASLDDVFNIVLFSTFAAMAKGGSSGVSDFLNIPISIVLGIAVGFAVGFSLYKFFEICYNHNKKIRNSTKVIILLAVALMLTSLETILSDRVPFSGLLAVVSMACIVRMKSNREVVSRLTQKFGKLWIAAEVVLFVLVGAAIDFRYAVQAGAGVAVMIFVSLAFRCLGVWICLVKTKLSVKERLFCTIAYLPKATVQAAIGSVPLAMGLACGELALTVAVTAIVITAPLGALGMDMTYKRLLSQKAKSEFTKKN